MSQMKIISLQTQKTYLISNKYLSEKAIEETVVIKHTTLSMEGTLRITFTVPLRGIIFCWTLNYKIRFNCF